MAKGKRPVQAESTPWSRYGLVLIGLALAGGLVWWVTRAEGPEDGIDVQTQTDPNAPQPLDLSGGPTVQAAATVDVPPESLASAGPDVPGGVVVSNDPRLGDADAPVTIIELSDFECPYCARFHGETFPALRRLYGDRIQWIYVNKYFPQHPNAERAALAAECAHRQGRFWEYAERLFAGQERLGSGVIEEAASQIGLDGPAFSACLQNRETAAEVAADQAEGDRIGVDATPTFIVNGHKIVGAQPVSVFNQIIAPYFSE